MVNKITKFIISIGSYSHSLYLDPHSNDLDPHWHDLDPTHLPITLMQDDLRWLAWELSKF